MTASIGNAERPLAASSATGAAAALVHVGEEVDGIRRRGAGRGFFYADCDGRKINDNETLARIAALAIPPAWSDVWICPTEHGHIQATGRDQRGRKQYRYHDDWVSVRDAVKFDSVIEFARALPAIRAQVDSDLRRRGPAKQRILASIVWLLDNALIRIGNDSYRRENGSFGLTTLQPRHVDIDGSLVRLEFRGKSGKEWRLKLADRRIVRVVKAVSELRGQYLFQYVDEFGDRRPVRSHDVNDYIRDAACKDFTSKHFRTWAATTHAAILFAGTIVPESARARARCLNEVIDTVARRLRNTRSVCRSGYIHPEIMAAWTDGRLNEDLAVLRRRHRRPFKGLDKEESLVLRWLVGRAEQAKGPCPSQ